jgi:hypothetical protein
LRIGIADALDFAQVDMADEGMAPVAAQLFAALLADGQDLDRLARATSSLARTRASLTMDELKPPQRPRSDVITTRRCT